MAKFDSVIPPGQTGKIIAKLSTKNYQGKISKSIVVHSNDPQSPKTRLNISCAVSGVNIHPYSRIYFNVREGAQQVKELVLQTIGEEKLTVSAESSNPLIAVDVLPLNQPKPNEQFQYWQQAKILVTLPSTYPPGRVTEAVTVKTNSPNDPEIRIPLSGKVFGALTISPERVVMQSDANGTIPPATITLEKKDENDFTITKVIASPDDLKAELKTGIKGSQYSVILNWQKSAARGVIQGKITVHSNDFFQPVINIPVSIEIR
ncbi:hypothetical protein JXJ21_14365 [candidate division KSB1 bacterium]|nr:hypothetical protein [candidate division KSB1 bacterium]